MHLAAATAHTLSALTVQCRCHYAAAPRYLNKNRLSGSLPATWANQGPVQDLQHAVLQNMEYMWACVAGSITFDSL